jgi:pyruvate dehydrogenase E2 component (dihydrolipoamide acetyltransferase)
MAHKILMPSGGQTTDEMVILKWNKNVGDKVLRGDILFEIETDKASMSVESFTDGILLEVFFQEGELVKEGTVVAYVGDYADNIPEEAEKQVIKQVDIETESILGQNITAGSSTSILEYEQHYKNPEKIYASPLAKNIAKTENLSLEDIAKFYSKNLIKKDDVNNYIIESKSVGAEKDYYLQDTSLMRRTIAKRMEESVLTAPHYTVSVDVDMTELIKLRNKLNECMDDHDYKITYNDFLMKIAAKAIELFPLINSSYQEEKIKIFKDVNFGLAVGLENGLIVPVVKQVNKKSLTEISIANTRNIAAAKNHKLQEQDITGGTITLSNLGMYGINNFTAIINQPESCILAVGGIIQKPVVKDQQIVVREMMNITGSFDHRIIDGTLGAAFLNKVKEIIQNPYLILI